MRSILGMLKAPVVAAGALLAMTGGVLAAGQGFHRSGGHGHAGSGPGFEEHARHMAEALGLSEEQRAAGRALHQEIAAAAEPLMEEKRRYHEEILGLLAADRPDATAIGERVIAAHAAKQRLRQLHESGMERFKALLTDEQKERLSELRQRHPHPDRDLLPE